MAKYPKLVQIAWDVIETFIKDWQNDPYRYLNEISFQVEIYKRLNTVLELCGYGVIKGNYKKGILESYKGMQNWSRVVCEPPYCYKWKDGKYYNFYPDIVIYDDIPNPDNPPDIARYKNWPALLICEIKVDAKDDDKNNRDLEKLKILLKNKEEVLYGCWLNFRFKESSEKQTFEWKNVEQIGNLFKCNISVPLRTDKNQI